MWGLVGWNVARDLKQGRSSVAHTLPPASNKIVNQGYNHFEEVVSHVHGPYVIS